MHTVIYLQNSPTVGTLDTALQKQDVTVPPIVTMPASWNKPKTRVRIVIIGDFVLPNHGDLFLRKLWLGKTQLSVCSAQCIVPGEGRTFRDQHDFILYGDNLHAIHSAHHTGINPTTFLAPAEGNSLNMKQNNAAVHATTELSRNDAPLIIDGNWNNFSLTVFASLQKEGKVPYSIREFSIEQIEL